MRRDRRDDGQRGRGATGCRGAASRGRSGSDRRGSVLRRRSFRQRSRPPHAPARILGLRCALHQRRDHAARGAAGTLRTAARLEGARLTSGSSTAATCASPSRRARPPASPRPGPPWNSTTCDASAARRLCRRAAPRARAPRSTACERNSVVVVPWPDERCRASLGPDERLAQFSTGRSRDSTTSVVADQRGQRRAQPCADVGVEGLELLHRIFSRAISSVELLDARAAVPRRRSSRCRRWSSRRGEIARVCAARSRSSRRAPRARASRCRPPPASQPPASARRTPPPTGGRTWRRSRNRPCSAPSGGRRTAAARGCRSRPHACARTSRARTTRSSAVRARCHRRRHSSSRVLARIGASAHCTRARGHLLAPFFNSSARICEITSLRNCASRGSSPDEHLHRRPERR